MPEPIDWKTFWETDHKAEDWLCEPLLPRGKSISMYSPAKTGKSLLMLDMAARLATGQRALDTPAGEPVNVVYLDLEMTEDDLAERLEDMGYGPESDLSHFHYYLLPSLPPMDEIEGGEALLDIALNHEAQLVIIDTTSRVIRGSENDADTLRAFYLVTGLPLKNAGITLLRLDHSGKDLSRGARGTSAKNDDVDLVWELLAQEGGIRLRATHRRQSWIPEVLDLVKVDDSIFHHERAATASPPVGTMALVALLDQMNIPTDWGGMKVRAALREAGHQGRNKLIAAAIKWRKAVPDGRGQVRPEQSGTGTGTGSENRYGDSLGDRWGQPLSHKAVPSPSLGGDSLTNGDNSRLCAFCAGPAVDIDPQERPVCERHIPVRYKQRG